MPLQHPPGTHFALRLGRPGGKIGQIRVALRGDGEPCWIRTSDLLIKSQLLYRLS